MSRYYIVPDTPPRAFYMIDRRAFDTPAFATDAQYNRKPKTSCPRGTILRKAYTRTSSTGKRTRVQATCVVDKGRRGRGRKTLPPVRKPGWLRSFGYQMSLSAEKRRTALKKAIRSEGNPIKVYRRLILIHNYQQVSNPAVAKKLKSDYQWIKKTHM